MKVFSVSDGAAVCGGVCYGPDIKISRAWKCDSREVEPTDAFVALKGAKTDGHLYVGQAISRGAKLILLNKSELERLNVRSARYAGVSFIAADDTYAALPLIAAEYLKRVSPLTCAVTGSVGKTTTRELTAAALKKRFKTHSAQRSFNTLVGTSLTVLSSPQEAEALVLELGANHFGEIREMVKYFPPEIAVITEVAACHLEGFGSLEGVLRAKTEICESKNLKAVVYNADNPLLRDYMSYNYDNIIKLSVGGKEAFDFFIKNVNVSVDENGPKTNVSIRRNGRCFALSSSLFGVQHAYNMAYAYAVAEFFGEKPEEIAAGIAATSPIAGRGVCKKTARRGWVIDEAYNANPASAGVAIRNAREAARSLNVKKIAILGGMRELGRDSGEWHKKIAKEASDFDAVLLLGEEWRAACPLPDNFILADTLRDLISKIDFDDLDEKLILVKGSNFYGLKRVVAAMTEGV